MITFAEFEGLDGVAEFFARMPAVSAKAARLAINQTADRGGLKLARDEIMDQIAFPKDYLNGDRLAVTRRATESNLEAVITGRQRATSLARFAAPGTPVGSALRNGVRVKVKTGGGTQVLRRAWLVRLRSGNIGLAVRIAAGDSFRNKTNAPTTWLVKGKVALLYGPSVDQVFRDVSGDIAPRVGEMAAQEFLRQFTRLAT